jgi:uncharacterized protein
VRELVVLARSPVLGRVKTRLQARLSAEQALGLHRAFVADVLELACGAPADRVTAAFTDEAAPELVPAGVALARQSGAGLGERLAHAAGAAFGRGARSVVLLGTDSPDLPAERLAAAFTALLEHDVVIGPAEDGGYYLIGLGGPHLGVFEGIDWGSARVLAQTRRAADALGLRRFELPTWYDVDRPEDLVRLAAALAVRRAEGARVPERTARVLSLL